MILSQTSLDALLDMTTGEPVIPAFLKHDSHFEDEAAKEHRIKPMLPRPRIEKRQALHKPPLTGYVSIGLLKMILSHTRLDALLNMTTGEPTIRAFHNNNSKCKL